MEHGDNGVAISKECLAEIPSLASSNITEKALPFQENCVICLSPITERAVAVPCDHLTFDFICLVSWLQERTRCPLCNSEVIEVQYDWCSPTDCKVFKVTAPQSKPDPQSRQQRSHNPAYRQHQRRNIRTRQDGNSHTNDVDTALERRRYVYQHKLYSLHVGSNRISRYANFTPSLFAQTPELQARARGWIRRELRVFRFLDPDAATSPNMTRVNNIEFLISYIIAILKSVEVKGSSGQAEEMLQEFLGRENARLFLHELNAWLRSPFTRLQDWDRAVQYREPLSLVTNNRRKSARSSTNSGIGEASSSRD